MSTSYKARHLARRYDSSGSARLGYRGKHRSERHGSPGEVLRRGQFMNKILSASADTSLPVPYIHER